ncbi:Zn(II)2Cys6 transcription factor domain-containing protein [Aspergillus fischeri NRRL 181]|uniref:C6 transcription factor, putative n=1 Tax=Neosartorya fischeri (strain ATCC 1020 / DSM 3700 / CBS 544.65 / FGSC A1164 / JCM 1740 / NRRL 181 / WB 181) TaxID=331117 RepID=A1DJ00_NEOFI|nr:C6 transcription factor, putative [Aspergillus fischeri NRRL 181]EAW19357.1 C6 transcription factor, putative [Aspergillus fischeri NRRL 181]
MPLRTGVSRSRNGCLTCKIRRVKCDEEKPTCRRCRSTGRKCDGYASPSSSTRRQSTDLRIIQYTSQVPEPMKMSMFPSFHQPLAGCDYRALEFFHFQTVSCFGPKAGDFLLRAAYHDAPVRVAATALGSLHRAFVRDGDGPAVAQSGLTRYALQQYSSAIHLALNQIPVTEGQSTDSILIMCVLFFCFESLQGHFRNAVQHGIAGLRILRQREERFLNEGIVARLPPSIVRLMFVTIENQMLEIDWQSYLPVSIQSTLLSPSKLPPVNLDDTPTLEQLSDSFQFCYNQYLKFLYLSQRLESAELVQILQQNQAYYAQMRQHMHAWSDKFDAFLGAHVQTDQSEADRVTINHLKMWRKVMGIFLNMDASSSEGVLDRFASEFGAILCLAEDLINSSSCTPASRSKPSVRVQPSRQQQKTLPTILPKPESSSSSSSSSSFFVVSLGLVPLLWIIATSCRHSQIRHRAIDLMSRSRRREGVWDSVLFSTLARKMVTMEEEAAGFAKGAMYEPADLPISARTNAVAGEFCEGRQGKIEFFRNGTKLREEVIQW